VNKKTLNQLKVPALNRLPPVSKKHYFLLLLNRSLVFFLFQFVVHHLCQIPASIVINLQVCRSEIVANASKTVFLKGFPSNCCFIPFVLLNSINCTIHDTTLSLQKDSFLIEFFFLLYYRCIFALVAFDYVYKFSVFFYYY
jgi:hypothetical protein